VSAFGKSTRIGRVGIVECDRESDIAEVLLGEDGFMDAGQ